MTETIYFVQNGLASHNQEKPSSLTLSEGDTPDHLLFQATHPKEHVQTELLSLF